MRHKLIEVASGNEVKPGMTVLDFRNNIWKVVSFRMSAPPSTGKVLVQSTDNQHHQQEFYPSVLGLKIEEIGE